MTRITPYTFKQGVISNRLLDCEFINKGPNSFTVSNYSASKIMKTTVGISFHHKLAVIHDTYQMAYGIHAPDKACFFEEIENTSHTQISDRIILSGIFAGFSTSVFKTLDLTQPFSKWFDPKLFLPSDDEKTDGFWVIRTTGTGIGRSTTTVHKIKAEKCR